MMTLLSRTLLIRTMGVRKLVRIREVRIHALSGIRNSYCTFVVPEAVIRIIVLSTFPSSIDFLPQAFFLPIFVQFISQNFSFKRGILEQASAKITLHQKKKNRRTDVPCMPPSFCSGSSCGGEGRRYFLPKPKVNLECRSERNLIQRFFDLPRELYASLAEPRGQYK